MSAWPSPPRPPPHDTENDRGYNEPTHYNAKQYKLIGILVNVTEELSRLTQKRHHYRREWLDFKAVNP